MGRFIQWIKSWRKTKKILSAIEQKINDVLRLNATNDQMIAKSLSKIGKLEGELADEMRELRLLIREKETIAKRQDEALVAAREQIKTLDEIVVPGLVAANKTFETTWDYQAAQNAMMQAAAHQQRNPEE